MKKEWLYDRTPPEAADDTKPHPGWTLDKALKHYAEHHSPAKKGAMQEQARIAQWRERPISKKKLGEITTADLQTFVGDRTANGRSGSTVRSDIFVVRALYRDLIPALPNPCLKLELPRAAPHRERRLQDGEGEEKGEEERLRSELAKWKRKPDELLDMLDFSIETGLRLSELYAVHVKNIRTVAGITRVEIGDSKNSDARTVVLTAKAKDIATRLAAGKKPDKRLFSVSDSARKRAWAAARKNAGITDLRWHDLRHEGISRMASKDLHLGELMAQSGHRDAESLKRYLNARAQDIAKKLG